MACDQRRVPSASPLQMTADNLSALTSPQHVVEKYQKCCKKTQTHVYRNIDLRVGHLQPAWILALSTYPSHIPIYIIKEKRFIYIYTHTNGYLFLCLFLSLRLSPNNVDKLDNFSPNPVSMRYTGYPLVGQTSQTRGPNTHLEHTYDTQNM
jgi:hypothetical protein